ncbi:unnamed protein product [Leuciscus chuanchicus]
MSPSLAPLMFETEGKTTHNPPLYSPQDSTPRLISPVKSLSREREQDRDRERQKKERNRRRWDSGICGTPHLNQQEVKFEAFSTARMKAQVPWMVFHSRFLDEKIED